MFSDFELRNRKNEPKTPLSTFIYFLNNIENAHIHTANTNYDKKSGILTVNLKHQMRNC